MILSRYYILIFFTLSMGVFAQRSEKIRELIKKIETEKEDTNRVKELILLSEYLFKSNYGQSMKYSGEAIQLAKKLNRSDLVINALNAFADAYWYAAEYDKSFKYYYRAYQIADSLDLKVEISRSLYNLGWLACIEQRNYKEIGYLYRSLQIAQQLNEVGGVQRVYNALGSCYSFKFKEFRQKADFDSADYYLKKGLTFSEEHNESDGVSTYYVNLSDLYYMIRDFKTASVYAHQSIDNSRLDDDSADIAYAYFKIAQCDFEFGKQREALQVFKNSFGVFVRLGYKEAQVEALQSLASGYYRIGEYKTAYEYYDQYATAKSDIDERIFATSLKGMEDVRSLEMAKANVLQLRQSNEIQELKNKRKTIYISVLAGIGFVIVVIAFLLFRQGKLREVTNRRLKEQNQIISEKKQEIEQSIEYAKGIQTAFLPSKDELGLVVKENFIFYKPKDVVSGDFYWYLINEDQKGVLLACADCTGHGVPGALMSMVGINILQQLSVERKMRSPGLILKYLNAEIKNSLKQNTDQSTQRDGMDIAMIYLDLAEQKLVYSGANRPLYIVRDEELMEYKATKHAIGGFTKYDQSFEEIKIDLQKNDLICLSTDGYADQFGREGKKFMTKRLKELLARNSQMSAAQQMAELESVFNNWKGLQEQVDDVCLIGLRV